VHFIDDSLGLSSFKFCEDNSVIQWQSRPISFYSEKDSKTQQ